MIGLKPEGNASPAEEDIVHVVDVIDDDSATTGLITDTWDFSNSLLIAWNT